MLEGSKHVIIIESINIAILPLCFDVDEQIWYIFVIQSWHIIKTFD